MENGNGGEKGNESVLSTAITNKTWTAYHKVKNGTRFPDGKEAMFS